MRRLFNIGTWLLGLALAISLLAFSEDCRRDLRIADIQVEIDHRDEYLFVVPEEIRDLVYEDYPYLDSLYCREINMNMLEERLDNHPSIHKAEVYSTLTGILKIQISQKRPVFRVQKSDRAYYIDETGDNMPLSPHYSALVPLVTGNLSEETESMILSFFNYLNQDSYFQGLFHGLHVNQTGEWILYPIAGQHKIFLGKPVQLEDKLERLKIFYRETEDSEIARSMKTLNLAFDKQVVYTKS